MKTYSQRLREAANNAKKRNPSMTWQEAREAARSYLNGRFIYPSDKALQRHGDYVMKTDGFEPEKKPVGTVEVVG